MSRLPTELVVNGVTFQLQISLADRFVNWLDPIKGQERMMARTRMAVTCLQQGAAEQSIRPVTDIFVKRRQKFKGSTNGALGSETEQPAVQTDQPKAAPPISRQTEARRDYEQQPQPLPDLSDIKPYQFPPPGVEICRHC
jgi:hypothetical protein